MKGRHTDDSKSIQRGYGHRGNLVLLYMSFYVQRRHRDDYRINHNASVGRRADVQSRRVYRILVYVINLPCQRVFYHVVRATYTCDG